MKEIIFRPIRFNKKRNKVVVASYMQWRNVRTANYNKFALKVIDEYSHLDNNTRVYNHEGEDLFFYDHHPDSVPVFDKHDLLSVEEIVAQYKSYGIRWEYDGSVNYNARGMDCDGVPTFTHFTPDSIVNSHTDMTPLVPLTIGIVKKWIGWFLYNLDKSTLTIQKS